jgi:hypothetical protein
VHGMAAGIVRLRKMLFNSALSPGVAAVGERQSLESLLLDPWELIEEREPDRSQRTVTSL